MPSAEANFRSRAIDTAAEWDEAVSVNPSRRDEKCLTHRHIKVTA